MLTGSEKKYFVLTALFLIAGAGIKAYRHASVRIGPLAPEMPAEPTPPATSTEPASSAMTASAVADSGDGVPAPPPAENRSLEPIRGPSREPPALKTGSSRKIPGVGRIPLNRAGVAELSTLKGIGEKTARAIVAYRDAHGPFRDAEELKRIKGIGEKKLEGMRPNLTVEPP